MNDKDKIKEIEKLLYTMQSNDCMENIIDKIIVILNK